MKKVILSLVVAMPMMTWAHGSKIEATSAAVHETLSMFDKNETAESKANFSGVKAWPVGAAITAKVYVNQNNKEVAISYSCVMQDADTHKVVCTKQ